MGFPFDDGILPMENRAIPDKLELRIRQGLIAFVGLQKMKRKDRDIGIIATTRRDAIYGRRGGRLDRGLS